MGSSISRLRREAMCFRLRFRDFHWATDPDFAGFLRREASWICAVLRDETGSIGMRRGAHSSKNGSYLFKWTGAWLSEGEASWDNHGNLGSGTGGTDDRELPADAGGPLAHSLKAEVPILALLSEGGVDANAVVPDEHDKVMSVLQSNFQATAPRVHTCIADRLVTNSVNLVADHGVHFSCVSGQRKRGFHRTLQSAFIGGSAEGFREIVPLRG